MGGTLGVTGNATFGTGVTITGAQTNSSTLRVGGTFTAVGNGTVGGALTVTGTQTNAGNLVVTGTINGCPTGTVTEVVAGQTNVFVNGLLYSHNP